MFDRYTVRLTLIRDMLATNPCDPQVLDTHILDRQRKLILDKSKINAEINKYLDQIQISDDRKEEEVNALFAKLEEMFGITLSLDEREKVLKDGLVSLKETIAEVATKGTTVFFWDTKQNRPCIGDHMIYGYLKAAAEAICRTVKERARGKVLESASYTQALINQHIRCHERFITFDKDVKRNEAGNPIYYQRSLRAMTAQGPRISLAKSEVVEAGAKLEFTLKVIKDSPITLDVLKRMFDYGELSGLGQWRNAGFGQFTYEITRQ